MPSTGSPSASAETAAASRSPRAPLVEVFASLQGEGRHTGHPTVFVRTATCPIRCRYCDTPHSYTAAAEFPVGDGGGTRRNPVDAAFLVDLVDGVARGPFGDGQGAPAMVSFTGGEPLVHAAFVADAGSRLRAAGRMVALETAALDPAALERALPGVDHLSADWKLPGTLTCGTDYGDAHRACIDAALAAGRTVDVKVVLTADVGDGEFERFLAAIRPVADRVQCILQPVTPHGPVTEGPGAMRLAEFVRRSTAAGVPVRVMTQMHKFLGLP